MKVQLNCELCGCSIERNQRAKYLSEGQVERIVWGHLPSKPGNSLIQFIGYKSGCVACMGVAAEQKVPDVWRHLLDAQCFVMHFVKEVIAFRNCSKSHFCVWDFDENTMKFVIDIELSFRFCSNPRSYVSSNHITFSIF